MTATPQGSAHMTASFVSPSTCGATAYTTATPLKSACAKERVCDCKHRIVVCAFVCVYDSDTLGKRTRFTVCACQRIRIIYTLPWRLLLCRWHRALVPGGAPLPCGDHDVGGDAQNCGLGSYCPWGSAAPISCGPRGAVDAVLGPANGPAYYVDTAACRGHCYNGAPGQLSTCE